MSQTQHLLQLTSKKIKKKTHKTIYVCVYIGRLDYKGYLSPSLKKPKEDDLQVGCG